MAPQDPFFRSFFIGGFECSTHYIRSGRRLDMIAATRHDQFAFQDYQRLQELGIRTAREGIRWHLIEKSPNRYDFSSVVPILRAAQETKTQIIWDLFHYGWPDHLEFFSKEWTLHFARFSKAFVRWLQKETDDLPFFTPINEPSFLSWAGAEEAWMNPFTRGRSFEMKVQLIRAAVEAMEQILEICPEATFAPVDPLIRVVADPSRPGDIPGARDKHESQFQSWDMLCGKFWPILGGQEQLMHIMGLNYYCHNQWIHGPGGTFIPRDNPLYQPLHQLLGEVYKRYQKPIYIAETGIENSDRRSWLHHVCSEVKKAQELGIPIHGICLYPIVNHPGWEDERHCHNGLWDYADEKGEREIFKPLAEEVMAWQKVFQPLIRQVQHTS